ncbi:MAG: hypothetical protein HY332_12975 [Chloroflexi bacterium]|nr:hypothetical protein [Chloroflexota bacterium]
MGAMRPKPPSTTRTVRIALRERVVQGILAIIIWWAVYWRVGMLYGQVGGIIAATFAAWSYVLVTTYVAYVLHQRASANEGPRGPRPPGGRWPGASP